jgi:hypothetical protein
MHTRSACPLKRRSATFNRSRPNVRSRGSARAHHSTNVRYSHSIVQSRRSSSGQLWSSPNTCRAGSNTYETPNPSASWKSSHANNDIRVPQFHPVGRAIFPPLQNKTGHSVVRHVGFRPSGDRDAMARIANSQRCVSACNFDPLGGGPASKIDPLISFRSVRLPAFV